MINKIFQCYKKQLTSPNIVQFLEKITIIRQCHTFIIFNSLKILNDEIFSTLIVVEHVSYLDQKQILA